jgi:hypothetical protein
MTWAKFEDRFPWHRKVRGLSDTAFRLHVSAVCWSCEHLTDGHVPVEDLSLVSDVRRPDKAVDELVRRGLWDVVSDGWSLHDFLTYNESRTVVLARREADAERKRKGREGRKGSGSPSGVQPDVQADSGGESVRTGPARPEPTPTTELRKRAKPKTSAPDHLPLTDAMREWGRENCPLVTDPLAETERFLDHARANDKRFSDWAAAWRTWMGNAQKFAGQRPGNVRSIGRREMPAGTHPHLAHIYEQS